MGNQRRLKKDEAPDPARVYERAKPEAEVGMGRLHAEPAVPDKRCDSMHRAVKNRQPLRQINADDVLNAADGPTPVENLLSPPPGGWPSADDDEE